MNGKSDRSTITQFHKRLRMLVILGMLFGMFAPLAQTTTSTFAATINSASFSGGTGTYQAKDQKNAPTGPVYAKQGGVLTLSVKTDDKTKCVEVTVPYSTDTVIKISTSPASSWSFQFTAPAKADVADGEQIFTASAYSGFKETGTGSNKTIVCDAGPKEGVTPANASYILDNTGPTLKPSMTDKTGWSPAPNAAGWNNSNVTITWSASDGTGSGVKTGPTPASDSVTEDTKGVTKSSSATDQLGNSGSGSVTVKRDATAPGIRASRSPQANAHGWNNTDVTVSLTCYEQNLDNGNYSGLKICAFEGEETVPYPPLSKTLSNNGANQSLSATVVDVADNSASVTASGINIDKAAPTLSGAPTTSPSGTDAQGVQWYKGDVTIAWSAADQTGLSGLAGSAPANSTIMGEGKDLFASASVSDKAGNTTNANSAKVNIDRTAPNTSATAPSNWNNVDVTVSLSANDALSGVKSTHYSLNGAAERTYNSTDKISISSEGTHTLSFYSVDHAGNVEATKTVEVKIDKTKPEINHTQDPLANDNGWNNSDVTVTFTCTDGGSGIASCTAPQTVTTEGANQAVTGTATDNAGNSATDPATVSIDKTKPTIAASRDRAANDAGWYNDDVDVSFACADPKAANGTDGSGIASCTAPQTLGEGANQSATGTATDAADHSASATESGINVDKTAPTLTGTPSATGWSRADVMVTWSASDALSGLAGAVPAPSTVTGEGADLSASASVSDRAGNSTNVTVGGIKIDRTAPSTSASVPQALQSGWYAGAVDVTLTGVDSLSRVDKTYYSVDGGDAQVYSGPFSHSLTGEHTITFWSVDKAGNIEATKDAEGNPLASNMLMLKIDGTAPVTEISLPASFDNTWVAAVAPVAFSVTERESGVEGTYYRINGGDKQRFGAEPLTIATPGSHIITYWSVDVAGNVETERTYTVKFDDAPPTISASRTAANDHGWNNGDVTVTFTCDDLISGLADIAGCSDPETLTNEGEGELAEDGTRPGQSVTGTAVDKAGNTASTTVSGIRIDKTAPTLAPVRKTAANADGWNNGDVTIGWNGTDTLSGIDLATQPDDSTVNGEGSNLGASASIKDKAGNTGNGSISGIKIDRTAPNMSGQVVNNDGTPRSANDAGWYNTAVRVRFAASDPNLADGTAGSGVANQPEDEVLSANGANQSASASVSDRAGNSNRATVNGINIDSQAPESSANNQCDGKNGWCKGQTATVTISAVDQATLSGVKEIRYSINGGPWQTASGASVSVIVPLEAKSGTANVKFYAVDNAGNREAENGVALKYDNIAPTITSARNPAANGAGWNNSSTTVQFTAKDDDGGSGVDESTMKCTNGTAGSKAVDGSVTCTSTVSNETTADGVTITGEASDLAGNKGIDSPVTVKLDTTKPTITASAKTADGQAYTAGTWTKQAVTVSFTCSDALSGIPDKTCPAPVTVSKHGANQSVSGSVSDLAGNSASASFGNINIDTTAPSITVSGLKAIYTLGETVSLSCSATDADSGVNGSCSISATGGTANGVGTFNYTATATDNAGNTATQSGTYKVTYAWGGFLQPINDTAHQIGTSTSIFKAGGTVPTKFQLKRADGTIVQANSLPKWVTPVKGSATSASIDEIAYSDPVTAGGEYRWDSTAQQYIYNWGSAKSGAGYYWRLGVVLDDGQTYTVNIGLR